MRLLCPCCKTEVSREDLIEVYDLPPGCKCNPHDWGDPDDIPPVCNAFLPMNDIERAGRWTSERIDICGHCEHERKCHA